MRSESRDDPIDSIADPRTAQRNGSRRVPLLGLRRESLAELLSLSVPSLDRANSAGLIPRPIRLGGLLIWNRREIQSWLDHGAPPRSAWEAVWRTLRVRKGR
ncbi:MAG: hypothetical protein U0871_11965 [Gemmataceae bacterium]